MPFSVQDRLVDINDVAASQMTEEINPSVLILPQTNDAIIIPTIIITEPVNEIAPANVAASLPSAGFVVYRPPRLSQKHQLLRTMFHK
jgi:hypothetical protein